MFRDVQECRLIYLLQNKCESFPTRTVFCLLNIADDVLCRRRPRLVCLHLEQRLAEPDARLLFNDFLKLLRFAVTSRAVWLGGCTSLSGSAC